MLYVLYSVQRGANLNVVYNIVSLVGYSNTDSEGSREDESTEEDEDSRIADEDDNGISEDRREEEGTGGH